MTNTVVVKFSAVAIGVTRDETLARLDQLVADIIDSVGGMPWVSMDDDIQKKQADISSPIKDDQGMYYIGTRTCVFSGPLVPDYGQVALTEGFTVQKGVE